MDCGHNIKNVRLLILDKNPRAGLFSKSRYFLRDLIRNVLLFGRGPAAVSKSLISGLHQLDFSFQYNYVSENENYEAIGVLSDIGALQWAIGEKRAGRAARLIAGPNLCVLPTDFGGILMDSAIDKVIVPCQWVKDIYSQYGSEEFRNKITIWPAGVDIPAESLGKKTRRYAIIYKKDVPEDIFLAVSNGLKERNWQYRVIEYGKYRRPDYWEELKEAKFLVYLQKVESQGLAIFEAWARNVPTIVWESGMHIAPDGKEVYGKISVPYLSPMSGIPFSGTDNFLQKLAEFETQLDDFEPRQYMGSFSLKEAAKRYVELL